MPPWEQYAKPQGASRPWEQYQAPGQTDVIRGAPAAVRAVVGSVPDQDRLANLQKYYPDARPEGGDNFVFTDPTTQRPTLYNPKGLDAGDVASVGREVAQTLGGIGGGFAGAALAAPTGLMAAPLTVPVTAAIASQTAGEIYDRMMKAVNGTIDTRTAWQRVSDVTGGVLTEAALGRVGAEVGPLMSRGVAAVKNRMTGSTGGQILNDFRAIGAQPTAGVMTGNRSIQTIENAVAGTAGGAGVIQRHDEQMLDAIGKEAELLAQQYGQTLTKEGLGAHIKGAARSAIGRFSDRAEELYDIAGQKIPNTIRAVPQNTVDLLGRMQASPIAGDLPETSKAVVNPKVRSLLESFGEDISRAGGDGQVSYQSTKALRSRVGKILGDPVGYPDFDRAQLKELYGALSQDLDTIAQSAGPDAVQAHNVANRYYRNNMAKNIGFLEDVISKGTDEQAYTFAFGGIKDGGTKLRTLRRNMKPDEWDAVAGSTLWKMGQAPAGQQGATGDIFSPAAFLTNWNGMSAEAKTALFGGTRYMGLNPGLERLARVTAAVKDNAATRNTSNTTRSLMVLGLLGSGATILTGDPAAGATAVASGILAPRVAAKLLTNPKFVNWLGETAGRPANYNGWGAQIGRLVGIAEAEPEIREEIYQYTSALRGAR